MRLEFVIFCVTALLIANIYTEGRYLRDLTQYRKYYQMAGVAAVGYMLYFVIRKNPSNTRQIISSTHDFLKYMPVDKNATGFFRPMMKLISGPAGGELRMLSGGAAASAITAETTSSLARVATKRSVGETKKKFVAARQGWKCKQCSQQLSAWFEIDHVVRLQNGGSNAIENLVALCRECHAAKTGFENI